MSEKFKNIPLTTVCSNQESGRICIVDPEQRVLCLERQTVFDYAAQVDPATQGMRASTLEDTGLEEFYVGGDACTWLYGVALCTLAKAQERLLVRTDDETLTRELRGVGMTEILGPKVAIRQPCGRIVSMPDPSVGSSHSTFVN